MVQVIPISQRKMQLGVGNSHQILLTAEEGCMFMKQVVQATQASIDAVSDSESSIFLQWVWLASNSIGAMPTRQTSLKFFWSS